MNYYIDCYFESNSFTIKFGRRTEGEIHKEIASILIEKNAFVHQGNILLLKDIPFKDIENQLLLILNTLQNFNKKI